jgi:hypothetical protein
MLIPVPIIEELDPLLAIFVVPSPPPPIVMV